MSVTTAIRLGRRVELAGISEVIFKEKIWDTWGYYIELPGERGRTGWIPSRDEAISRARAEWPLLPDDLTQ